MREKIKVGNDTITVSVYDNNNTLDRYTIVFHGKDFDEGNGCQTMLGLSDNPTHYCGFSQFCSGVNDKHLGKPMRFKNLPTHIQEHIKYRISYDPDNS